MRKIAAALACVALCASQQATAETIYLHCKINEYKLHGFKSYPPDEGMEKIKYSYYFKIDFINNEINEIRIFNDGSSAGNDFSASTNMCSKPNSGDLSTAYCNFNRFTIGFWRHEAFWDHNFIVNRLTGSFEMNDRTSSYESYRKGVCEKSQNPFTNDPANKF